MAETSDSHSTYLAEAIRRVERNAGQRTCWIEVVGAYEHAMVSPAEVAANPLTDDEALSARLKLTYFAAEELGIALEAVNPLAVFPGTQPDAVIFAVTSAALRYRKPDTELSQVRITGTITRYRGGRGDELKDVVDWDSVADCVVSPISEMAAHVILNRFIGGLPVDHIDLGDGEMGV
jgi:hypothetical protein